MTPKAKNSAVVGLLVAVVAVVAWMVNPYRFGVPRAEAAVPVVKVTPSASSRAVPAAVPSPTPTATSSPVAVSQPDLPNALNPGTCIQYAPTGRARDQVVYLDAGHGGVDPGAVGLTSSGEVVAEKTATLAVELNALGLLRAAGFDVVVSRTTDTTVARLVASDYDSGTMSAHAVRLDALARAACANDSNAFVLVAIHFNADSNPAFGGAMTVFDDARSFTPENLRLAGLVQAALTSAYRGAGIGVTDLGTVADSQSGTPALTARGAAYGHLIELGPQSSGWVDNPSAMPGILVEPLHVSRPAEADLATSAQGQTLMASAIVAGIEQFLGPRPPHPTIRSS